MTLHDSLRFIQQLKALIRKTLFWGPLQSFEFYIIFFLSYQLFTKYSDDLVVICTKANTHKKVIMQVRNMYLFMFLPLPRSSHLFVPLVTQTHNLRVGSEGCLVSEQLPLVCINFCTATKLSEVQGQEFH